MTTIHRTSGALGPQRARTISDIARENLREGIVRYAQTLARAGDPQNPFVRTRRVELSAELAAAARLVDHDQLLKLCHEIKLPGPVSRGGLFADLLSLCREIERDLSHAPHLSPVRERVADLAARLESEAKKVR